jgi:hypothetical protein
MATYTYLHDTGITGVIRPYMSRLLGLLGLQASSIPYRTMCFKVLARR